MLLRNIRMCCCALYMRALKCVPGGSTVIYLYVVFVLLSLCCVPPLFLMYDIEDICFFEVHRKKKQIFFLFYTIHGHFPIHKVGGENAKTKNF